MSSIETPWIEGSGLAAQLQILVGGVGERDEWGVLVEVQEDAQSAVVTLDVPAGLPQASKNQLGPFRTPVVAYTEQDRRLDEYRAEPADSWNAASGFVKTVSEVRSAARAAVTSACFAHARGEAWACDVEPVRRLP